MDYEKRFSDPNYFNSILTELQQEIRTKLSYCKDDYARSFDDLVMLTTNKQERSPEGGRGIRFEKNSASDLIRMAETSGYIQGLEFALDEIKIALGVIFYKKLNGEEK